LFAIKNYLAPLFYILKGGHGLIFLLGREKS